MTLQQARTSWWRVPVHVIVILAQVSDTYSWDRFITLLEVNSVQALFDGLLRRLDLEVVPALPRLQEL